MQYRTLGRTGLKVSVIGVGTWQLGGEWGRAYTSTDAREILTAAQSEGLNLIDTAECYGDHLAERLIGETLPGQRQDWVIATKWGHKFHTCFKRDPCYQAADLLTQLEESLKALRTDYVDLLQFHSGNDDAFADEAMWTAARQAQAQGKVRYLGNSIGANTNLKQTDASTAVGVDVIQVIYNRLQREPEVEVFPSCQRQQLGVLARVPLASGLLSGKYLPGHIFPANDVREVWQKKGSGHAAGGDRENRGYRGARRIADGPMGTSVVPAPPGGYRGDSGMQGRRPGPRQRGGSTNGGVRWNRIER